MLNPSPCFSKYALRGKIKRWEVLLSAVHDPAPNRHSMQNPFYALSSVITGIFLAFSERCSVEGLSS